LKEEVVYESTVDGIRAFFTKCLFL